MHFLLQHLQPDKNRAVRKIGNRTFSTLLARKGLESRPRFPDFLFRFSAYVAVSDTTNTLRKNIMM